MQITHEQARRWIQFQADDSLNKTEQDLLLSHIDSCEECRRYAGSLQELGSILRPLMHKRWNQQPMPLPAVTQAPRRKFKITQDILLATRIVAMCVICMAVLINIWQYTQSTPQGDDGSPVSAPPVPTPSIQTTNTTVNTQECNEISYSVQEGDTLEGIASQFSVARDEITRINDLSAGKGLEPAMILRIPICTSTPSGTPLTTMTLYTPRTSTTTSTPVGSPTQ